MRTFELKPQNGRKSFGGKAKVIETDDKIQLKSYDTIVAQIDKQTNELTVNGKYSMTTNTHIKSFREFYSV